jgi:hypothetical protein
LSNSLHAVQNATAINRPSRTFNKDAQASGQMSRIFEIDGYGGSGLFALYVP